MDRQKIHNIFTNNGAETQNKTFKHAYLSKSSDKSLTGTITVLIEGFLPETYRQFSRTNSNSSSKIKLYNPEVPDFLHNRPHQYVRHVMSRYSAAKIEMDQKLLEVLSPTIVRVKSATTPLTYTVDFDTVTCTCPDFNIHNQICKHFCACFIYLSPKFSYDRLPEDYKNNPLNCLQIVENSHSQSQETNVPATQCRPSGGLKQLETMRELAKRIIDMTYNVEEGAEVEAIQSDIDKLHTISENMEKRLPKTQDSLTLLKTADLKKKRKATLNPEARVLKKPCLDKIPKPAKVLNKSKFHGRVGETADKWRAALKCDINLNKDVR